MSQKKDMAPEDIRTALNKLGWTFRDVDREYRLPPYTACKTARYPHEEGEKAIATILKKAPHQIWPSRFGPRPTFLRLKPQPQPNYKPRPRLRKSQKRSVA